MNVSTTLIVVMAVLFAAGVYAMMERSLTRVLIGFLLLGNAVNLLLLIVMGAPGVSPFHGEEGAMSDPLPQALTLTALVITFAISAFLLALIYRSWQIGQADVVEDDAEDIALRARMPGSREDEMDDETEPILEEAATDFVDDVDVTLEPGSGAEPPEPGDADAGPEAGEPEPDGEVPEAGRGGVETGGGEGEPERGGDAEHAAGRRDPTEPDPRDPTEADDPSARHDEGGAR